MARVTKKLALLGGLPTFDPPIHVGGPSLGNEKKFFSRVKRVIRSRQFTNDGPFVKEFESEIGARLGVKHVIAVCNATAGFELTLRALGIKGEILVPAFTFAATAHAPLWLGIKPVFVDIDPLTHLMDPTEVERVMTPKTTAIFGVHLWGQPCRPKELETIAKKHNLRLIFDAAHAFGSDFRGTPVGNFGIAEIFSFHATKIVSAFEGGAITTNDDTLARDLRLMRNFGFSGYDQVSALGINAKLCEISAVAGLTSLETFEKRASSYRRNQEIYRQRLQPVAGVRVLNYPAEDANNHQYVVTEIDEQAVGFSRDELMKVLWSEGIRARRYFYPGCHRMEPYRSLPEYSALTFPAAERVCERVLVLPNSATDSAAARKVCDVVAAAIAHAGELRATFGARNVREAA